MIALEKVSDEKVSSYGIVEAKNSNDKMHEVSRFLEKPKSSETNSRLGVIGKYIITPEVFEYLEKDGFLKATVDYALDRDDLGEEFAQFLKEKFSK